MSDKEKAQLILKKIESIYPNAKSELTNWNTPFQFLICIILSAQTTDKGVNKVTKELFEKYPTQKELSVASFEDVYKIIRTVNYSTSKTKYIIETAGMIVNDFNGQVPNTVSELIKLKGVGEKTANVFLNDLYRKNEGIAVDTHVARVAQRMGLTKEKDPKKIARDLEKLYPKEEWYKVNACFVLYGRYICRANMKKSECVLKEYCSYCRDK